MDSKDPTAAQAQKMQDRLSAYLGYLHPVKRRMEARCVPLTDELLQATDTAYDATHPVTSCQSRVRTAAKTGNEETWIMVDIGANLEEIAPPNSRVAG
jgi:hypothetical protein